MKKFLLFTLIFIISIGLFMFNSKKEINLMSKKFNVYINEDGSYVKQEGGAFPTTGYFLNTSESTCTNGGSVSQNASNKSINVSLTSSDKCNLYFDPESTQTLDILHTLNNDIILKSGTPDFTKIAPLPTSYTDNGIGTTESNWTPSINTYYITYGDGYTFNTTTGGYSLTNPQTCQWNQCYMSLTDKYITEKTLYSNSYLHGQNDSKTLYQVTSNSTNTVVYYKTSSKTINAYDTSDTGLFSMEDDYGQSIYFRGDITNNYVKYGKDKNNNDMYFRIIRINGDGSLRIIYDGTSAYDNGEKSTDRVVGNSSFNSGTGRPYDAGYVGYMYGNFTAPTGCSCSGYDIIGNCIYTCSSGGSTSFEQAHENVNSSTVKVYLENWYLENIVNTGYDDYISDEIFCNDRTKKEQNLGYGQYETLFGSYERLKTNKNPSLICIRKQDRFTDIDETNGNGLLSRPVGFVTADEMVVAGAKVGTTNKKFYLYKGFAYWSFSPSHLNANGTASVFNYSESLNHNQVHESAYNVAPVINLSKEAVQSFTGDGTMNNPFHGN